MYLKWIKRVVFSISVLVVTVTAAAIFAGYYYRDSIVPVITKELNNRLKTEVHVDEIHVTFLKHFPKASIEFEGAAAMGSDHTVQADTLFSIEKLYLSFNLIDLYKGNFTLSQIEAQNGFVNMRINEAGISNFEFYESAKDDTASGSFQTALEKVVLKNIRYRFSDLPHEAFYDFYIQNLTGNGHFTDEESQIAMYGNIDNKIISLSGVSYLPGENIQPDVALEMNPKRDFYQISRGIVKVRNKHRFEVKGKYTGGGAFEWRFKGDNLDFDAVKALTPAVWAKSFNELQASGNLEFQGRVKRDRGESIPDFTSDFIWQKGRLDFPEQNVSGRDLYLRGKFMRNARDHKTGTLSIDSISCVLNGGAFYGRLYAKNPEALQFKAFISHQNNLPAYENVLSSDTLDILKANFDVSGYLSGTVIPGDSFNFDKFTAFGKDIKLNVKNGEVALKNSPLHFSTLQTALRIKNNDVFVDSLSADLLQSPVSLRGTWRNALGFMAGQDEIFRFFGSAKLESVNFQKLFPGEENGGNEKFELPSNLLVDLSTFEVRNFTYNKFNLRDVAGQFSIRPGNICFENLSAQTLGGNVKGDAAITDEPAKVDFKGDARDIDITALFESFNDFGSEDLVAENVKGRLNTAFTVMLPLNEDGSPDYDFMAGVVDFEVKNGELIDYKPLQQTTAFVRENKILNVFIKLDDFEERLKHIQFEKLSNTVKVREGVLYIPDMKIYSSALDIEVGGEQHFSGKIDYALNFNIKQVLQKSRVQETEYGYIEDDGSGGKIIFLLVGGTVDNPIVKLDKIRSRKKTKENIKKEIEMTKAVLKEDFGLFKGDTTLPDIREPERQDMQIEFDPEAGYVDEPAEGDSGSDQNRDTTETEQKGFFQKVKEKVARDKTKESDFDDWDFEDDDF